MWMNGNCKRSKERLSIKLARALLAISYLGTLLQSQKNEVMGYRGGG